MTRIFKRKDRGNEWWIDYQIGTKRIRKCLHTKSRRLAEDILVDTKAKLLRTEYDLYSPPTSLQKVINDYLNYAKVTVGPYSYKTYKAHLTNFINFTKDVEYIHQVTRKTIEDYYIERQKKIKPSTLKLELYQIKFLFKYAVKHKYLNQNPAQDIKFPPQVPKAMRFFSENELRLIFTNGKYYTPIYQTLYYTGMRIGELVNLRVSDIKYKENIIKIQAKSGWQPKTRKIRIIPIHPKVGSILQNFTDNKELDDYVFLSKRGKPCRSKNIWDCLKGLLNKLNIPNASPHTFRHTFASHLVEKGCDLYAVSKLLGHSTLEMTQMYAHLAPDKLGHIVELLPALVTNDKEK